MNGWKKLDEYYNRLGDNPLYTAAIILNPTLRMKWLERHWTSGEQLSWLREAQDGLRSYWGQYYQDKSLSREQANATIDQAVGLSQQMTSTADITSIPDQSEFSNWVHASEPEAPSVEDEIEQYMGLDRSNFEASINPIDWWLTRRDTFPTLSKLALGIFAIPAMSADCERAFSLAKLTLSSQRLSMSSDTLEQLQCLDEILLHGWQNNPLPRRRVSPEPRDPPSPM